MELSRAPRFPYLAFDRVDVLVTSLIHSQRDIQYFLLTALILSGVLKELLDAGETPLLSAL